MLDSVSVRQQPFEFSYFRALREMTARQGSNGRLDFGLADRVVRQRNTVRQGWIPSYR